MNFYKFKNKVTLTSLFFGAIVITPLVDTINGAFVLQYGGTGVSIGTFYRFFLILFSVLVCTQNRMKTRQLLWVLLSLYFPMNCIVRYNFYSLSFMSSFSYGMKWVFPIILIVCFDKLQEKSDDRICIKIMDCWSYLIPGLLFIEYILGLGEKTYWDAGFRGLYYSINDVGFSLTMMMSYSLYKLIMIEVNIKHIFAVGLNFVAIIILATKSCLMFSVLGICYFLFIKYKKSTRKAVFYTFIVAALIIIGVNLMHEKLTEMLERYIRFYDQMSINGSMFAKIMSFLTSARTPRIGRTMNELSLHFSIVKILFGWKAPWYEGAIEMDWFDSFFQHGIFGLAILFGYCYSFMFRQVNYKIPWLYMLLLAMVCSFFSGHVLNGALSSTVLAIVVQCASSSRKSKDVKNIDCCEQKLMTNIMN